jgi:L-malate glycosyltransferase
VLPSLDVGGVESLRLDLAREARDPQFDLRFVSLRGGGVTADRLTELGYRVDVLRTSGHPLDPRVAWRLFRLLRTQAVDVVHAAIFEANVHAVIAGSLAGVPVVVTEEVGVPMTRPYWARRLAMLAHARAAGVVAESRSVARHLERVEAVPSKKIHVIHNCARVAPSHDARDAIRAELGIAPGEFVVGSVGRLIPEKAFEVLIRSVGLLAPTRPRLRLLIAGDGPERPALEAEIRRLGLSDAVRLLGQRSDVHRLLRAMDAFVLPSRSEGLGIALIEAMLAGLPVVGSNVDGIPEVIRDPSEGLLVPPDDPQALATAIVRILDDRSGAQAMAARATISAQARFSPERYRDQILALYEDLMRGRRVRQRTVFVCYSGDHPQYLEALYAPQLEHVARGADVHVISFESDRLPKTRREELAARFARSGIGWTVMPYHRRPLFLAKATDVFVGSMAVLARVLRGARVIHARSHVAGAMALPATIMLGAKLVFDIDGSLPDEYVDSGRWTTEGWPYRVTKAVERILLRAATIVVVHTEAQAERLSRSVPHVRVQVIRHGIDARRFEVDPEVRRTRERELALEEKLVLVHSGGADARVYRLEEIGRFVRHLSEVEPRAHLLVLALGGSDAGAIAAALARGGLPARRTTLLVGTPPERIPSYLALASAGLAFRDLPGTAYVISPVKVAEYLAAGLPVVTHEGIGDIPRILRETRTGIVLRSLDDSAHREGVRDLLSLLADPAVRSRACEAALEHFGIDRAASAILRAYGSEKTGSRV